MVAKCANPLCHREFRELNKGKLFLLPPTYPFSESMSRLTRLIDHCYWLCPDCVKTHHIKMNGTQPVVYRMERMAVPRQA